jgi:hypothetical protein
VIAHISTSQVIHWEITAIVLAVMIVIALTLYNGGKK